MIPRETRCVWVRVANLKQRMTEAEADSLTFICDEYAVRYTPRPKSGLCILGREWNEIIRPAMLGRRLKTRPATDSGLERHPLDALLDEIGRRGYEVSIRRPAK